MRITTDGVNPPFSKRIGSTATREQSHRFNHDLLGEVNFWRDFLSDSKPRIILAFGQDQAIVISTKLLEGSIEWPGIPPEYAISFRNIEYSDDLFTWGDLNRLDQFEAYEEEAEQEEDG